MPGRVTYQPMGERSWRMRGSRVKRGLLRVQDGAVLTRCSRLYGARRTERQTDGPTGCKQDGWDSKHPPHAGSHGEDECDEVGEATGRAGNGMSQMDHRPRVWLKLEAAVFLVPVSCFCRKSLWRARPSLRCKPPSLPDSKRNPPPFLSSTVHLEFYSLEMESLLCEPRSAGAPVVVNVGWRGFALCQGCCQSH